MIYPLCYTGAMTKTAQRIATIAENLSPEAQQALLDIAENLAQPSGFYETMTNEQRTDLERSIAEAERGEVVGQAELDRHLDTLFAGKA